MTSFARRRARFNRKVTNPLLRPISGWVPAWSIVEHVGLRSGKTYRTPVSVFRTDDGVAILLPYGTDTDWVRNVRAANGGQVKLSGKTFRVTSPRIVPTADAVETVKPPWGRIMKATGIESTLLLTRAS
ncbi:nitroreductase family deazaflavin-dependent oxidoreductase [Mycobacterium sp.]|uniref:nitroreductase family deazaflavin-dependent oxidoreductase n=1 Tax=Mycobacterium sp. TaxID=1785 RepID=UPI003C71FB1D